MVQQPQMGLLCVMTLNMEYYDNNNMGQWHYAKIKENKLLVKPSIPTPNLEANTLIHITILKNSVTFSYIYIYIKNKLFRHIPKHRYPIWKITICTTSHV